MRVLHVINTLGTGGAENLVVNLASSMRAAGESSRIVTLGAEQGVPAATAATRDIPVLALGRSARDPRALLRLGAEMRGADVVHVHLFPALYLAAACRRSDVPLVYTEHSTWNRRRERRVFHAPDRRSYGRYDAVVAISDGARDALQEYFATIRVDRAIDVIPNGIDDEFFSGDHVTGRVPGRPLRLVAVGTLDSRKNFADAIAAVAQTPGATLTIAGDGPERSALERQVEASGLGDRVTLLGRRSDIKAVLLDHDALLSTSRFEGFSLVAAEALAVGRPVIGPAIPGFSESVIHGETGLLYAPDTRSVAPIVDAIRTLENDSALHARLAGNGRRDAERFRISRTARSYLEVYERVRR